MTMSRFAILVLLSNLFACGEVPAQILACYSIDVSGFETEVRSASVRITRIGGDGAVIFEQTIPLTTFDSATSQAITQENPEVTSVRIELSAELEREGGVPLPISQVAEVEFVPGQAVDISLLLAPGCADDRRCFDTQTCVINEAGQPDCAPIVVPDRCLRNHRTGEAPASCTGSVDPRVNAICLVPSDFEN